jgi:tryptophan-rich sensory protein
MKKKIIHFIFLLILFVIYLLPSLLIKTDKTFYENLNNAFIPPLVFIIAWCTIYIIQSYLNVYLFTKRELLDKKELTKYNFFIVINYLSMIGFLTAFNIHNNLFASYIFTLICFLTTVIIFMQVLLLDKKKSFLMLPYIAWTIFASIYAILLYLKN